MGGIGDSCPALYRILGPLETFNHHLLNPELLQSLQPVKAVRQQELAVDLKDRHRRQPALGVFIPLHRLLVDPAPEVDLWVRHDVLDRYFYLHDSRPPYALIRVL